jgi:hypothetical protein
MLRNLTTSIVAPALGAFKTKDRKAGSRTNVKTCCPQNLPPPIFQLRFLRFSFSYWPKLRRVEIKRKRDVVPLNRGLAAYAPEDFVRNCCITRFLSRFAVAGSRFEVVPVMRQILRDRKQ